MADIFETNGFGGDVESLWQQAFGDSREDIRFFLIECTNKLCVCLRDGQELLSMLFLVDCTVNGEQFKYIYAACTNRRHKKQGYMTQLLEYCTGRYRRVVLIPADSGLAEYYFKRNFIHKIDINDILFNESSEIKDFLMDGCLLEEPYALAAYGG